MGNWAALPLEGKVAMLLEAGKIRLSNVEAFTGIFSRARLVSGVLNIHLEQSSLSHVLAWPL